MAGFVRAITKSNVDNLIADYLALVETIGASVAGMSGLRLLKALKRDQVKVGPYPHVTLFEAANRIMTDMVILYGVKWILSTNAFPFETYNVEYGNEDSHGFDLRASSNGRQLVGEAFNVAPSFFSAQKDVDAEETTCTRDCGGVQITNVQRKRSAGRIQAVSKAD